MSAPLVTLTDVSFSYAYGERPALSDVTLRIEQGKLYGVIGPNGSGKTTLCGVLRGVVPHFHQGDLTGDVQIFGASTWDWEATELADSIGYVFQNPFTQISGVKDTVFEEIAFGLENQGVPPDEIMDRVLDVIDLVGIAPLVEKNPSGLSGGQRQLVAFAAIIAMDSQLIVIDEPTSQLDPETSEKVFAIIDSLQEQGRTIVLVEHDIDLLAQYADELIVLHHGRVLEAGPTREVLDSEALDSAEIPRPDVTELALALRRAGHAVPELPLTREDAIALLEDRAGRVPPTREEDSDADRL
ncbi:MAG: ABC transporter ATP-binding protein [Brachybacterium sp.]|nr:ABC transporter ATP-binding protein [Brachybacterium sp.]